MALKSTVYRVELDVSDIDRGYYASHTLTLARHPSEAEQRLMVRLLAFVLHADPRLAFGRGLSADEDPDLWIRDDTGAVRLWIDVGLPDERRVRRAAGRDRTEVPEMNASEPPRPAPSRHRPIDTSQSSTGPGHSTNSGWSSGDGSASNRR